MTKIHTDGKEVFYHSLFFSSPERLDRLVGPPYRYRTAAGPTNTLHAVAIGGA
jgi:hypothetical protein